jgi:hypothetical protein
VTDRPSTVAEPAGASTPTRPVRSWLTATSVAVAVVAIVAASAVAVLAFTTDDGAASPEEATRSMVEAVARNDVLGIVEQLPPGERRALREPVARLATQLQRLRLVGRLDPTRVPGLAFEFTDLEMRSSERGRDIRVVDVVGGRLRAEWFGGGQPLTDHARQILAREWGVTVDPVDATAERDFARQPLRLVAIREGGGWHVSLAYSLAEAARTANRLPLPGMGQGPPALGAERPESAVTDLVRAYADGDPERLVTLLHPAEARAAYDYAPAFLPELRARADRARDAGTYHVQLNRIDTAVEGTGERRRVRITSLDIDIRDEFHKQHIWWEDGCFFADERIEDDDEPYITTVSCSRDRPRPGDVTAPRDNPVASLALFGGSADLPTFTVIERSGRWFVNPVHSLLSSLADTAEHMEEDDIDGFVERWADSWRARGGDGLGAEPIRPTAAEVAADPTRAGARGKTMADRCAQLTSGPDTQEVTTACLRRIVREGQVRREDLPPAAQELVED